MASSKHSAEVAAAVGAVELVLKTPPPGTDEFMVTSAMINQLKALLWNAEPAHAENSCPGPARRPPSGEQDLDTEKKFVHHGIRMATFDTMMTLAREVRTNTGYKRSPDEAHALIRQTLRQSETIDPTVPGQQTIALDPLPPRPKPRPSTNSGNTSQPPNPATPAPN